MLPYPKETIEVEAADYLWASFLFQPVSCVAPNLYGREARMTSRKNGGEKVLYAKSRILFVEISPALKATRRVDSGWKPDGTAGAIRGPK
jgi:hypothetical protein